MNWSFLFKHWFGTLLIGPIVTDIIAYLIIDNSNKIGGLTEVYPIALLFGLIFSTPTYILYSLLYYLFAQKNINLNFAKIILIVFAVLGVIVTGQIIKGNMIENSIIAYSISSIMTGLFFKLNFKKK